MDAVNWLCLRPVVLVMVVVCACCAANNDEEEDRYHYSEPLIGDAERMTNFRTYSCEPSEFRWGEEEPFCDDCDSFLMDYHEGEEQMPKEPNCFDVVRLDGKLWTVCPAYPMPRCCAMCYAGGLVFCGLENWRLPTISELISIGDTNRTYPAQIERPFRVYIGGPYVWSSEIGVDEFDDVSAKLFNFRNLLIEYADMCGIGNSPLLVHDLDGIDWPPDDGSVVPATPER